MTAGTERPPDHTVAAPGRRDSDRAGTGDLTRFPRWLAPLAQAARAVRPEQVTRFLPPPEGGRRSAVLMLFGEGPEGPDILLIERAATLRSHAGQPAFPGGAADPGDDGPVSTALREAREEVGLDPVGVRVVTTLPALFLPPSGFVVAPVLAWWQTPSPVYPADPREVAGVERVPVAELADPANRVRARHPSGWVGPAFDVRGLLVWGFTAGLLDTLLRLGGWERPWEPGTLRELPRLAAPTGPGMVAPEDASVPDH